MDVMIEDLTRAQYYHKKKARGEIKERAGKSHDSALRKMMASQRSHSDPIAATKYPGSSGVSTTNESELTQFYPQSSDSLAAEFKCVVVKIARQLDARDRETIGYLKSEELGPDREEMTGLSMLVELEKAGMFYARDTTNLVKLLEDCGRCDLVNKYLKPYRRKFADDLAPEDSPLDGEDQIVTCTVV